MVHYPLLLVLATFRVMFSQKNDRGEFRLESQNIITLRVTQNIVSNAIVHDA